MNNRLLAKETTIANGALILLNGRPAGEQVLCARLYIYIYMLGLETASDCRIDDLDARREGRIDSGSKQKRGIRRPARIKASVFCCRVVRVLTGLDHLARQSSLNPNVSARSSILEPDVLLAFGLYQICEFPARE